MDNKANKFNAVKHDYILAKGTGLNLPLVVLFYGIEALTALASINSDEMCLPA